MEDSPHLVSIGLPVFNEAEHLAEALDSLLAQDYENIEVIISDNASTDATAAICASYVARDSRVRLYRNDHNVGGIENFNRVFELAKGEFFMWASGHDVRHPSAVSSCLEILLQDTALVLCYTQPIWIGQDGQELEKVHEYVDTRGAREALARLNIVLWGLHSGFPIYGVFRTAVLRKTSLYTQVFSPDMSLLIELSVLGPFAFRPDPPLLLRRARDYGSIATYVAKHFRTGASAFNAEMLYWRMLGQLSRRVAHHFRSIPGKTLAVLFVLVGSAINFRWMLELLRSLKQKEKDSQPLGAERREAR